MKRATGILTLLACVSIGASGATIVVNSTGAGNNVPGVCVLRDAISAANSAAAVGGCNAGSTSNIISLPAGAVISLTTVDNTSPTYGQNGLPIVTSDLQIDGNGAVIQRSTAAPCNKDGVADAGEFRIMQFGGASLDLRNLTLRDGCADGSGAVVGGALVVSSAAQVAIRHSTIEGNYARLGAGALVVADGSFTLEYSTIAHNDGSTFGPSAVELGMSPSQVASSIFNSTISDNFGGVLPAVYGTGALQLVSSTITRNEGGGALNYRHPTSMAGSIQIKNSIVADNYTTNCNLANDASLSVQGANLSSDTSCTNFSLPSTPARLASLGYYGGSTRTHEPLAASAAIDAVTDCTTTAASNVTDDQRGTARPLDGNHDATLRCDIGAVECDGDLIFANSYD